MDRNEKERVVNELTDKLKSAETLIVADYRGLTMPQIDSLRGKLVEHGRAVHGREEHAHAPCGRGRRRRRAACDARGAVGDRLHRERRRHGRCGQGPRRLRPRHEDPRDPRRPDAGPHDLGGRRGRARQAPAGRRPARPGAGRDRRPAAEPARARQRAAAEPGRADRRPHRAARGATGGGAGRRLPRRSPQPRSPRAEAEAPEAAIRH